MARILHVSDWHVGASLYRCDRLGDHRAVLEETIALAGAHEPDLIIHSGDVFDALMPGHRAMRLGIDALNRLADIAPVIVLAGNHDHPRLFEVFAALRGADPRLRFVPFVRRQVIDVPAGGERIRVAAVPFIHQNRFVDWFGESTGIHASYADKMRQINAELRDLLEEDVDHSADVLIYAAHLHVTGATLSGSERRVHVTEDYAATTESLPPVAYAALGHIHQPQSLAGLQTGCYGGSALQLDFGERDEAKSVVLVDVEPGRPAVIERLALTAGRRLRLVRGTLDEVEAAAGEVEDAIVKVVVDCIDPIDGLTDLVRAWMPAATLVEVVENAASTRLEAAALPADEQEPTLDELFEEYLTEFDTKAVPAASVRDLFGALREAAYDPDGAVRLAGLDDLLTCELPEPVA